LRYKCRRSASRRREEIFLSGKRQNAPARFARFLHDVSCCLSSPGSVGWRSSTGASRVAWLTQGDCSNDIDRIGEYCQCACNNEPRIGKLGEHADGLVGCLPQLNLTENAYRVAQTDRSIEQGNPRAIPACAIRVGCGASECATNACEEEQAKTSSRETLASSKSRPLTNE